MATISDDDGVLRVVVTRGGAEVSADVDVAEAHDALVDAGQRAAGKDNAALWAEYRGWADRLGLPGLSAVGITRLIGVVEGAYKEVLGKPPAGDTASPG